MVPEFKEIAGQVGRRPEYREGADYVQSLDLLPLGRVVDDAKVGDHHAIIPTNSEHALEKMNADDRRVYDLVTRRFLAVFHPDAEFENTRVETTVASHIFRTRGKVLLVRAGAASTASCRRATAPPVTTTRGATSSSRAWSAARRSTPTTSSPWRRRPSRRGATATPRCWGPWRRRASSSTTRRCARR